MKVAIVTGSNKGIGLAIVRGMCRQFEGDVYLTFRNPKQGGEAQKQLEEEGLEAKYHQLDIVSEDSIARLAVFMMEKYGGVDVLINNAGMAYSDDSTVPDIEQATKTMGTNFTGTLNMMRVFLPLMKPHGRIVNLSSVAGALSRLTTQELRDKFTSPTLTEQELVSLIDQYVADVGEGSHKEKWGSSHYGMSKTGVTAMTKVFAREIEKSGREDILISSCCPGWVKTDMAGDKAPLTPDEGAETPILCALLPAGSPNGEFWKDREITKC